MKQLVSRSFPFGENLVKREGPRSIDLLIVAGVPRQISLRTSAAFPQIQRCIHLHLARASTIEASSTLKRLFKLGCIDTEQSHIMALFGARALGLCCFVAIVSSIADGQKDFLGSACLDTVCDNGLPCLSIFDQSTCGSNGMPESLCTCGGVGKLRGSRG